MTTRTFSPTDRGSTIATRSAGRHTSHEALAREAIARMAGTRIYPQDNYAEPPARRSDATLPSQDLDNFLGLVLRGDIDAAMIRIEDLLSAGHDYLFLAEALFAPTARLLGARWDDSQLSFLQVSLGMSTLLAVNARVRNAAIATATGRRGQTIFATLPQQAHTLGAILAAEAFRQRDYDVELLLGSVADEVEAETRRFDVRLVGLTAGAQDRVCDLCHLVSALKHLPRPPAIMVGGAAARLGSAVLEEAGADCIASTIDDALEFADTLFPPRL